MKKCECQAVSGGDATYCLSCGRRLPENAAAERAPVQAESDRTVSANEQRRRRMPILVGCFVAVVLVVAVGLTVGLRNVHIDVDSGNLVPVSLPLNVCKTFVGGASDTLAKLPAKVRVDLSSGNSTKLAFYTDNEGLIEVIAPTGWTCSGLIAADGSSSIQVAPPGQPNISDESLKGLKAELITASQTSACVGCRESLACPLFVSAANDYQRAFQKSCPTTKPPSETETRITGNAVEFTDPPGVVGDGRPSGGAYPALGAMTYFEDLSGDASWTVTCVLPPQDKSMCKAIVGNFVDKYGKR